MSNHQYEVFSPLSYDDFNKKKKKLFNLLITIRNYPGANWEKAPITEKYYYCAKQCFVKRYCKCGGNSIDAFRFIKRVEDLPRGKKVQELISKEDLLILEEPLQYIKMFVFF